MKTDNVRDFFRDLADVIRSKEHSEALISPQEMAHRIAALAGKHFEVVERTTLIGVLKDIADALRFVHGTIETINPQDFASLITTTIAYLEVEPAEVQWITPDSDVVYAVRSNVEWNVE